MLCHSSTVIRVHCTANHILGFLVKALLFCGQNRRRLLNSFWWVLISIFALSIASVVYGIHLGSGKRLPKDGLYSNKPISRYCDDERENNDEKRY